MTPPGLSFDTIADEYDRYRGAYPAEFIETVLEILDGNLATTACEIGCGSGQATIRLAERGISVTCVEPGRELLTLARSRLLKHPNVTFLESTFESAELELNHYDLVFAANAMHWVDEHQRYSKSHAILKPGGHLLAVWRWNHPLSGKLGQTVNDIFAARVPAMKMESRAQYEIGALTYFQELVATKSFWRSQIRRIPYGWEKSSKDYASWIGTWSQLATLSDSERQDVCRSVKAAIDAAGGAIFESGETVIICGQKPE